MFFGELARASARASFERTTNVGAHGIDATNETPVSLAGLDLQSSAMAIFDLHEATIAYEMRECPGVIVHAVVIDAENADVFGERGKAAGAAEQAIAWYGRTNGVEGARDTN